MKMRIVHISDIHLSSSNSTAFKHFYLKALLDDLRFMNQENKIDIICLTGDLLDKGGMSFKIDGNRYRYFIDEFWLPISKALSLGNDKLFFIPGNHDLNEGSIDSFVESGLVVNLNNIESVNEFVDKYRNIPYAAIERQKEFKDFEKDFFSGLENSYVSNFESCHVVEINGARVGVACLNSSWRCSSKQTADSLVMGSVQITNAAQFFESKNCDFVIGMIHHPIDFISSIEREEDITRLKTSSYDIVLFGHTHHGITQYSYGNNGNLFISTARTGFSNPRETTEKYKSGYTIIDINDLSVSCKFRKYITSRNAFDKDVELAPNGEFEASLFPKSGREDFYKLMNLSNETYKLKVEDINEALVIHGTDSVAPKSVSEIFVLPRLTDSPVGYGSFDKIKYYSLDEIVTLSDNILLSGGKEFGKSTLLNKIFVDVAEGFPVFQKIPIKIDFIEIQNKDIKSIAKNYISKLSNSELDTLMSDGKLLILIDNVFTGDESVQINSKLQDFLTKWPNVKVVAATSANAETFIEDDLNCISGFKTIYIGSVGAKQFKALATKWFDKKNDKWIKDSLGNLIKVFEKLKISRTFFSVSLFLWVVEKQVGFKPTNNHDLIMTFLKYILEGFNVNNARAGSYNFNKKVELLAEVALEMFNLGDKMNSYGLKESSVIAVLQKNFSENQLKLKASEKVDELTRKGIFKYDITNGCLQFRYESFFQFFLAKNIGTDEVFTSTVTNGENFLNFVEEIDFYTGYKRNDKVMLLRAVDEVEKGFADLDAAYGDKNVDNYFPSASLLFKRVSAAGFVQKTKDMKLKDEEIEEVMGRQMDMLPTNDSIKVKKSLSNKMIFSNSLEMVSRVLKNSENIKDPNLVNRVLDLIVLKAAKHGVYMQSLLNDHVRSSDEVLPVPKEILVYLGPIIAQGTLFNWMATESLELPLINKINGYLRAKAGQFSEFELFISSFLYADMKGDGFPEVLKSTVEKIKNKFILELCYLKMMEYYTMKSERSSLLPIFERIMIEIMIKVKGMSKSNARRVLNASLKDYKKERGDDIIELG